MQITVTKKQVVEALMTEPLAGGYFVHASGRNSRLSKKAGKFKNNSGCAVCAIGGILDLKIGNDVSPETLNDIARSITASSTYSILQYENSDGENKKPETTRNVRALANKTVKSSPLSSLSTLFEHLYRQKGMRSGNGLASKKLRMTLVRFVNENFPNKLVIDTDENY